MTIVRFKFVAQRPVRVENIYIQVISWSSLDWLRQKDTRRRWEWSIILGTAFDVIVHAVNVVMLAQYLSATDMCWGVMLAQAGSLLVLFSPRLAWANPSDVPPWVERRVRPISNADFKSVSL